MNKSRSAKSAGKEMRRGRLEGEDRKKREGKERRVQRWAMEQKMSLAMPEIRRVIRVKKKETSQIGRPQASTRGWVRKKSVPRKGIRSKPNNSGA